ncbi:MAG: response regulator transcription factor, partial [Sphingomonas sp.]
MAACRARAMPYETRPIRITLIDDHPLFRRGVRSLLEHEPDIEVVAESESGVVGLRILGDKRPDIVILDVSMPDLNGI